MKILLFGTGDYYRKYKSWFKQEEIIGLIDNDETKQGTLIDGYKVYLPCEAAGLLYDCVAILSVHEETMRKQLIELGVPENKIYKFSELYKHPEIVMADQPVVLWGNERVFSRITMNDQPETILIMSHNLDYNGASLVLFYLAQILIKSGFSIFFASWSDGVLRKHLYEKNIPTIIDPNLQMRTQKEVEWTHGFHRIICNTLNYYQFLSDRNLKDKIIWWLHDPEVFYKSLDQELLQRVKEDDLYVCAVGPIAEKAFKTHFPFFEVKQLLYGIPDVSFNKLPHKKLSFVTIGNVQEYKGQDILIQALKQLDEKVLEQIQVKIIGFQPSVYANAVKKSAEGLGNVVEFIPPVDREEIHRVLEKTDVMICPSRADSMPVVVNEAMQHCLVCIISDATGNAAYVEDGKNGLIVKQGDVKALAEKIRWCVECRDKLEEMGKAARKIYEQYFSIEVFEKNLLRIVREAFYED
ncbi:MAG: glycosyltransferase family 4 protein [Lachnospiraceae bacterium]|nr:glycosyltransferase family 4 protein [Lachnospiraceae bacterium]